MFKVYCDICEREMVPALTPNGGHSRDRLYATVHSHGANFHFEVLIGKDNGSNNAQLCKHCIIDAIKSADDRPMATT